MSWHFPLPKIRIVRFSLHTSRLSLHGERWSALWRWNSQWVHTFLCQKIFAIFVPPLSNGTSRATSDRKPKTNVQILPSPIIGSAEALPILCVRYFRWEREIQTERERDRDGSDVTIVALKLAMNLHFPLPKNRTIGDELTLSLAKNSHFSFLPSHFLSLPSRRGHHCGAEIRNDFTLSIAKIFFAL